MGMSAFGVEDSRISKASWSGIVDAGKAFKQDAGHYLHRGKHRAPQTVGQRISGAGQRAAYRAGTHVGRAEDSIIRGAGHVGEAVGRTEARVGEAVRNTASRAGAATELAQARAGRAGEAVSDRYKKLTPMQRKLLIGGGGVGVGGGAAGGGYAYTHRRRDNG